MSLDIIARLHGLRPVPHDVAVCTRARVRHGPPRPTGMWVRGVGIDDLQKRYSELILVTLRPHYDLVTLMDHIGSSLDRLGVDQRGRNFPPRAPRRLAVTLSGHFWSP